MYAWKGTGIIDWEESVLYGHEIIGTQEAHLHGSKWHWLAILCQKVVRLA